MTIAVIAEQESDVPIPKTRFPRKLAKYKKNIKIGLTYC
jgi:hypothetical protein